AQGTCGLENRDCRYQQRPYRTGYGFCTFPGMGGLKVSRVQEGKGRRASSFPVPAQAQYPLRSVPHRVETDPYIHSWLAPDPQYTFFGR
ncbi:hypothetical protein U0070_013936, partial [Myodes glareolus]